MVNKFQHTLIHSLYTDALVDSAEKLKDHESSIFNEIILTSH